MDLDSLKVDLDACFSQLPPDFLDQLSQLVLAHKDIFIKRLPVVLEGLTPHIQAGLMEFAMGIFQVKEVEDAIMEVLARYRLQSPLSETA